MIPNITKRVATGLACGVLAVFSVHSKTGAPHSLVTDANFTDVALSWSAPADSKDLRWHDNSDYNGDTAPTVDGQKITKTYVAAKFDANDLKNYVGEKVEAITFFQYRPVHKVTVMAYKNGEVISQAEADKSLYKKNTSLRVALAEAVTIEAGTEYMFAVCYEAGSNMDLVAIKDRGSDASGKGDLMSVDGKNWVATGNGEYLITANFANNVDEAPLGYNVYRGDEKLNSGLLTETAFKVTDQPVGTNVYYVSAVYADGEYKSAPTEVSLISYASLLPSVSTLSAKVNELDVTLNWTKPLLGGKELTWSDKSTGFSIGGTASSNTKVWVRNQFDATDLVAFRGGKITAINFNFTQAVVSGVTLFVIKDGVIDYSEVVSSDAISAIEANAWTKFALKKPYQIEDGHAYAYGLYVLHTPKEHPIGVDNSTTVDVKGNSFSVSSPNSVSFDKSKPSWKTLRSGGMEGNWMMTADIEGSADAIAAPVYDIYRDGELIKAGAEGYTYDDTVENLGKYNYSIVSRSGDNSSLPVACAANVKLPAAYAAPLLENSTFDSQTKELSLVWNMDKEISHCGAPVRKIGFDEEMPLMWGAQFSAAELAAYKGYSINKLKFVIAEEIGDFTVGVYTLKGAPLSTVDFPAGSIEPMMIYTLTLPETVKVTGEEGLIFAYSATLPANTSAIVLDEGPLVDGGAKISLSNGQNWLNLSTLSPDAAKYNIYISAMASEDMDAPAAAAGKAVEIGRATPMISKVVSADKVYGIDKIGGSAVKAPANQSSLPTVKGFNIYCNGEQIAFVDKYEYKETIKRFASYTYYVTTVFANGWESAASDKVSFSNRVAQKSVAPFGLIGEKSGDDLVLNWQASEQSTVLSYVPDDAKLMSLKMTGGTNYTSHCAAKFEASELTENVGNYVSHIQFGCGSTEISGASVIVMFGENIVYTQSVPVSTIVKGINDVRLNEPVEIPANTDVCVGFIMNYTSSTPHPLGCFECEDHVGLGDLISSSGSSGYWNSLHTKFSLNYCWYVKAILSAPDSELPVKAPANVASRAAVSYNVYRDGVLIDNVSDTSVTVKNAAEGKYYVTAVNGDQESGESNAVVFGNVSGIDEVGADQLAVLFDRASSTIIIGQDAVIEVYSMSGALVASGKGNLLSVSDLNAGVYTVKATTGEASVVAKIVK